VTKQKVMTSSPFVARVLAAIQSVDSPEPPLPKAIVEDLPGMSGRKTRLLYNALCRDVGTRYLEVGSYQGSTLVSALYGNIGESIQSAVAIDNFCEFDGTREKLDANLKAHLPSQALDDGVVRLVNKDAFEVQASDLADAGPFDVFVYDGAHDYRSHRRAVTHFADVLADTCVFLVDDYNWAEVRQGTADGLDDLRKTHGFEVVFEHTVRLTQANEHTPMPLAKESFWNGIAIFVLSRSHDGGVEKHRVLPNLKRVGQRAGGGAPRR
jgi:hypothetical protein